MKISIAERIKPFSHNAGSACLIPGTDWLIEAFPALIRLGRKHELELQITGPVKNFTLEQDLERNQVLVFGHAKEGFYRLRFQGSASGIEMLVVNAPCTGLRMNGASVAVRERLVFPYEIEFFIPESIERLSLGMHKHQDWDLVLRRFDLREILPVLFMLGQKVPAQTFQQYLVTIDSTSRCWEKGDLEAFCRIAFSKILVPRIFDDQYQGLCSLDITESDPSFLLRKAVHWIRACFFRQEGPVLSILPESPFKAGRLIHVQVDGIGEMDLEWASGRMRRAILRASANQKIALQLQKELKSFRIRSSLSSKGERLDSAMPFQVEEGETYFFDRFQADEP